MFSDQVQEAFGRLACGRARGEIIDLVADNDFFAVDGAEVEVALMGGVLDDVRL